MELNNTIAKPLYKQLEDQLKEEIDTGKRKAGSAQGSGLDFAGSRTGTSEHFARCTALPS